jgi:hypothetical protein
MFFNIFITVHKHRNDLVHVEPNHVHSTGSESGNLHEEASWIALSRVSVHAAGCDEHGIHVLSSKFASSYL